MLKKIILLGLVTAMCASLFAACFNPEDDTPGITDIPRATPAAAAEAEEEEEPGEIITEPRFPQYISRALFEDIVEPDFRGNMHVVVGRNGFLFENGYINEFLGSAPKYVNVTDAELIERVERLFDIQEALKDRGIAFVVVITPNKAASHSEFIPQFYIDEWPPLVDNYVRPYYRFLQFLKDHGVYHVDSSSLYRRIGMTNIFPRTGIHWNLMAAFETVDAIVTEFERQRGFEVRRLIAKGIIESPTPFGVEQDIFGLLYNTREGRQHIDNAWVDDRYYMPDVVLEPAGDKPRIGRTIIQGGSFKGELNRFFGGHGLASSTYLIWYNNNNNLDGLNWDRILRDTDLVLLEVNEQFVYNMGGTVPSWGQGDIDILPLGPNLIDHLWEFLR